MTVRKRRTSNMEPNLPYTPYFGNVTDYSKERKEMNRVVIITMSSFASALLVLAAFLIYYYYRYVHEDEWDKTYGYSQSSYGNPNVSVISRPQGITQRNDYENADFTDNPVYRSSILRNKRSPQTSDRSQSSPSSYTRHSRSEELFSPRYNRGKRISSISIHPPTELYSMHNKRIKISARNNSLDVKLYDAPTILLNGEPLAKKDSIVLEHSYHSISESEEKIKSRELALEYEYIRKRLNKLKPRSDRISNNSDLSNSEFWFSDNDEKLSRRELALEYKSIQKRLDKLAEHQRKNPDFLENSDISYSDNEGNNLTKASKREFFVYEEKNRLSLERLKRYNGTLTKKDKCKNTSVSSETLESTDTGISFIPTVCTSSRNSSRNDLNISNSKNKEKTKDIGEKNR